MNQCKKCGNKYDGVFCPICGEKTTSVHCVQCGASFDAPFCPECGTPKPNVQTANTPNNQTIQSPQVQSPQGQSPQVQSPQVQSHLNQQMNNQMQPIKPMQSMPPMPQANMPQANMPQANMPTAGVGNPNKAVQKKAFYKLWWVWLIIAVAIMALVTSGYFLFKIIDGKKNDKANADVSTSSEQTSKGENQNESDESYLTTGRLKYKLPAYWKEVTEGKSKTYFSDETKDEFIAVVPMEIKLEEEYKTEEGWKKIVNVICDQLETSIPNFEPHKKVDTQMKDVDRATVVTGSAEKKGKPMSCEMYIIAHEGGISQLAYFVKDGFAKSNKSDFDNLIASLKFTKGNEDSTTSTPNGEPPKKDDTTTSDKVTSKPAGGTGDKPNTPPTTGGSGETPQKPENSNETPQGTDFPYTFTDTETDNTNVYTVNKTSVIQDITVDFEYLKGSKVVDTYTEIFSNVPPNRKISSNSFKPREQEDGTPGYDDVKVKITGVPSKYQEDATKNIKCTTKLNGKNIEITLTNNDKQEIEYCVIGAV
ncbi:MAG: hypothetical protein RSA99_02655, partial [Oscillospiraceae bacterium]